MFYILEEVIKDKKNSLKRHTVDFSKYTIIGFLVTIGNIFLMWLFIDMLRVPTLVASTIVVIGLHIVKFVSYQKVNLIKRQFVKFTIIQVVFGLLNIIGVWFMIDIFKQPTIFSSSFIVGLLFILRFLTFKITKLTVH
jgi:uncharacterized membrane protein (GlpM family)